MICWVVQYFLKNGQQEKEKKSVVPIRPRDRPFLIFNQIFIDLSLKFYFYDISLTYYCINMVYIHFRKVDRIFTIHDLEDVPYNSQFGNIDIYIYIYILLLKHQYCHSPNN